MNLIPNLILQPLVENAVRHGVSGKMGPGTVGQDHRTPEYCWIHGLVKGSSAILNTIRKWDES